MNKILAGLLALVIFVITACNNNKQNDQQDHTKNHDSMDHVKMQMNTMKDMKHDTMINMNNSNPDGSTATTGGEISVSKTNIGDKDPAVKEFINRLTKQYFFIKNELAADSPVGAKNWASKLNGTIKAFDNSFFTVRQKIEFDKHTADTRDQLQNIISANTIETQRSSFSILSQHIYELVKLFGADQVLYHDHCPMANNNKGALWLSETKEIKNPYLGKQMTSCGSIKEIIN